MTRQQPDTKMQFDLAIRGTGTGIPQRVVTNCHVIEGANAGKDLDSSTAGLIAASRGVKSKA